MSPGLSFCAPSFGFADVSFIPPPAAPADPEFEATGLLGGAAAPPATPADGAADAGRAEALCGDEPAGSARTCLSLR